MQGNGVTRFQIDKRLIALKQELSWLGEVASQPLQQGLAHLDKAFTRFFREKKSHPRFHANISTRRLDSLGNDVIYLPKAGWTRAVLSRRFHGKV